MTHDALQRRMQDAHSHGEARGYEAVDNCEPHEGETLREAAFHAERHARQFHGHIPQWIRDDAEFFHAYEDGVASAINDVTL